MAILSYESEDSLNREASNIRFDVPDDMNIYEYKIMCVRLAHAMGYHHSSVKNAFGDLDYETESDRDFKQFMEAVGELTGSFTL
jgi:hypothetical protein